MRCLFAASEVAGFAKTGGLADVAASLPRALVERGVDCAVIMPLYRSARNSSYHVEPTSLNFTVTMGHKHVKGALWRSALPPAGERGKPVPVYLVEQPEYFERDDPTHGGGIYQFVDARGQQADYADNCERYGFFCRAILEAIPLLDFWPDVLHVNDWQTGLAPVYLREIYGKGAASFQPPVRYAPIENRPYKYTGIKTLCTIHNLAFQGNFWHLDMPLLDLPWELFNFDRLEFYGHISFLKAALVYSDILTTVSPTYAKEIQTPYFGHGLQGVLMQRSNKLHGIVNGVDYHVWNPRTDPRLAANYDEETVAAEKPRCKAALQRYFGFEENPRTPLLGIVSRLADQKGFDLIAKSGADLIREGVQLAVLGQGGAAHHQMLGNLSRQFTRQVGFRMTQDEALAHQIEAGADMFLMPSQYEPCGLNQLYSLKYGTVPIVRATGGLADTVTDATDANLAAGTATGFRFVVYTPQEFLGAVRRALAMYRERPDQWLGLMHTGMRQDWSWNRSAAEYERLYQSLLKE